MSTEGGTAAAAPLSVVFVVGRFPPHHERRLDEHCRDVALVLGHRGHRVTVVTSGKGGRGAAQDHDIRVVRGLPSQPGPFKGAAAFLRALLRARRACRLVRRELRRSEAQVLCFWHQDDLPGALLALRPDSGAVHCDVWDEWLIELWRAGGNWFGPLARRPRSPVLAGLRTFTTHSLCGLLGVPSRPTAIPPGPTTFTSRSLWKRTLSAGLPVHNAEIVTLGVDLRWFKFRPERAPGTAAAPARLLFLGKVAREGGLHTAVLALRDLPEHTVLRVAGPVEDKEYLAEVAELGRATGVMGRIEFSAPVPHSELPELLRSATVLILADSEPELFPRTLLESFAVGTPVVGTALGPAADALIEGRTGLVFDVGNAHALARQLGRVLTDAALRDEIVRAARRLVETRYGVGYTAEQLERALRSTVEAATGATASA